MEHICREDVDDDRSNNRGPTSLVTVAGERRICADEAYKEKKKSRPPSAATERERKDTRTRDKKSKK